MLSCSAVLLKDLPQDTAPQLPLPPAAAPTVRPNVSRVLPLLRCSKVYRVLSRALVSCSRVKAAVANLHTDVDGCFWLRLITYQAAQFLYMSCFFLPCTMKHSDVDVFYIISSLRVRKKKINYQYIYFQVINYWFPSDCVPGSENQLIL